MQPFFLVYISFQLEAEAKEHINAAGCVVSPGFIDIHSHSDWSILRYSGAESRVFQGVTTEVIGQCGHSCAPVARAGDARRGAIGYSEDCGVDMGWLTFGRVRPIHVNLVLFGFVTPWLLAAAFYHVGVIPTSAAISLLVVAR